MFNCPFLTHRVSPTTAQNTRVVHSLPPVISGAETSASADFTHAFKNFGDLQFSLAVFNVKNYGLAVGDCQLFNSFFFIFFFYEPFNNVTAEQSVARQT